MKKALTSAIILFVMLLAVSAQADIKQHPIGIQIWVPDTWETEIDEGLLMTSSPDEGALVILMVLESDEIEIAMDEMDKELSQIIKKVRTTSEAEETPLYHPENRETLGKHRRGTPFGSVPARELLPPGKRCADQRTHRCCECH